MNRLLERLDRLAVTIWQPTKEFLIPEPVRRRINAWYERRRLARIARNREARIANELYADYLRWHEEVELRRHQNTEEQT